MLATDREIVSVSVINSLHNGLVLCLLAVVMVGGSATHAKNGALRTYAASTDYADVRQNSNIRGGVGQCVCRQKGKLLNKGDKYRKSQPYPTCYLFPPRPVSSAGALPPHGSGRRWPSVCCAHGGDGGVGQGHQPSPPSSDPGFLTHSDA